eukprot:SAG11_NODE_13918_length_633_cov_0.996255_1_plen_118_part_00
MRGDMRNAKKSQPYASSDDLYSSMMIYITTATHTQPLFEQVSPPGERHEAKFLVQKRENHHSAWVLRCGEVLSTLCRDPIDPYCALVTIKLRVLQGIVYAVAAFICGGLELKPRCLH